MTPNHRIVLDVERLDDYYERMMDEVYVAHHTYPTYIKKYNSYPEDPNDPGLYAGDIVSFAGY